MKKLLLLLLLLAPIETYAWGSACFGSPFRPPGCSMFAEAICVCPEDGYCYWVWINC